MHFFASASNLAKGAECYMRLILLDSSITPKLVMAENQIYELDRHNFQARAALDAIELVDVIKNVIKNVKNSIILVV